MGEWAVLIRDHHRGFVTWDQYEADLQVLAGNRRPAAGQGGGALREGPALLQGLIRCGKCSRVMRVRYSGGAPGRPGSCPRHECVKAKRHFGTERACQSVGGRKVEKLVLDQLFQVLEPASLAATAKAMTEAEQHWRAGLAVFETAVERARFDAERVMRQYDAVEPENRLVARTLERALEDKLATQRRAEHDLAAQQARRPAALVMRQVLPLAARPRLVQDRVDDLPHLVAALMAARRTVPRLPCRDHRLDQRPPLIAHVTRVPVAVRHEAMQAHPSPV
jgi:hypothetical protein